MHDSLFCEKLQSYVANPCARRSFKASFEGFQYFKLLEMLACDHLAAKWAREARVLLFI